MLTEDDLRELIDSAAAEAPAPTPLPEDLFRGEPSNVRPRRGRQLAIAAVVLVILGAGAAVVPGDQLPFLEQHIVGTGNGQDETVSAPTRGYGTAAGASASAGTGTGVGGGASQSVQPLPAPPADSPRIIKNGSLEILVGTGTVTESVNRLTALATGFGGYVSNSRTTASEQSGSQASALISVRVPAAAFEQLMGEASKLGEVQATTTSGQDVTAQFVDIDAQLTALTATRDQFLLVLGEAQNVNDILAVQDRITQVQIQIDQLEGQKRLLTDQTSFGTLSVTLLEPGATTAVPSVDDNKDLGDAWQDARRNFGDALENIVGASGTLAVVLLFGAATLGAAWMIYRRLRRRII
ncbi:MAG: hypothetical protein QOI95_1501 [Acidimicrobiaceae bacterium]|jgi:hypothetical protein